MMTPLRAIYYEIFHHDFFPTPLLLNLHSIYPSARKELLTIFKGYDTLKERRFVSSKSVRKSHRCFSVNERIQLGRRLHRQAVYLLSIIYRRIFVRSN